MPADAASPRSRRDPRLAPVEAWFRRRGWRLLPFQRRCWQAYLAGEDGLIQVPTGSGKTYAAVMGPMAQMLAAPPSEEPALQLLLLTPLRALSRDLAVALQEPITAMGWPLRVGLRTGDTTAGERARQKRRPPEILITTPESLAVLLASPDAPALFARLRAVVIDEWHELMGSKRGTQTELCLSWLRALSPGLRTWAVSASLGNPEEAAATAVGEGRPFTLVQAPLQRPLAIRTLLPDSIDGFPWAGHLGLRMHDRLVGALDPAVSTLIFTNTRNQAEQWHQCLRWACPEMDDRLALHHSAIDRAERERIEDGVKGGSIRWVVCTSSLDLGVDFQPVERVVQIGSAKNLARLLQRAGRSGHCPGGRAEVLFLPTHALELLEVSAMRRGLAAGLVERRRPPGLPLDVLLQHLTGLACGPGLDAEREWSVVRGCRSYRDLSRDDWEWCLQLLQEGGACLGAYPRYRKLEADGPLLRVRDPAIARLHRLNIGTITADQAVTVRLQRGGVLGHVEEAFAARLRPGDVFVFAGRSLQFVRLRERTAVVAAARGRSTTVPAWAGGQLALSDLLADGLRQELHRCATGGLDGPELQALQPLLARQDDLSRVPGPADLLVEFFRSREGSHLYAYPFEGRFVHEGLGFLWAWRLARRQAGTFTVSVNDYGFELLAPRGYPFATLFDAGLLEDGELEVELEASLNLSELCRRRFRGIAQVAGLVPGQIPGGVRRGGQLQLSAALLFDVFERHEPANLLLRQARREVLDEQLDLGRLRRALARLRTCELRLESPPRPGPLAFPLLVERLNSRLSNESLLERVQRMMAEASRQEARDP